MCIRDSIINSFCIVLLYRIVILKQRLAFCPRSDRQSLVRRPILSQTAPRDWMALHSSAVMSTSCHCHVGVYIATSNGTQASTADRFHSHRSSKQRRTSKRLIRRNSASQHGSDTLIARTERLRLAVNRQSHHRYRYYNVLPAQTCSLSSSSLSARY